MRNTLVALWLFIKSGLIAGFSRFQAYRYPNSQLNSQGFVFRETAPLAEVIVFNKIRHSKAYWFLKRFSSRVVLVATVNNGFVWVNAYRVVRDKEETDLLMINDPHYGENGRFNYMADRDGLYHAKNASSKTRGKGFLETDPCFAFKLELSQREMRELTELMNRETTPINDLQRTLEMDDDGIHVCTVLEGDVVQRQPMVSFQEQAMSSLGILAEPLRR